MKNIEQQRAAILDAKKRGKWAVLKTYTKFSGPGWLQSAITLGGGSLASALYLGVLGGFGFMWLQPLAMILGIAMLGAIAYITLSIKSPLEALNKNISPLLGYGWACGSMFACFVFAMPQFALGTAAITQNLGWLADTRANQIAITAVLFVFAMSMVAMYAVGGKWVGIFEIAIKISVAAIVICFFGVVVSLSVQGKIPWGRICGGFVPNFSVLFAPSEDFAKYIAQLGEAGRGYWSALIVSQQRDVVISAAAMAVGINMTFLFPFSMLKKGWNEDFRGLAIFDLATGLFVPFMLATSCIVIASASQFHAKPYAELVSAKVENGALVGTSHIAPNLAKGYVSLLDARIASDIGAEKFASFAQPQKDALRNALSVPEKNMASMLVKRDASNLSETLEPLVGKDVARYIFGFGVLGMAINAMLMNMLICGLCFAQITKAGGSAKRHLIGSSLIAVSAATSLFFEGAKMWLVVYAGVAAMVLLPIAYGAFFAMMNSRKIMGKHMPTGTSRAVWNVFMGASVAASATASLWVLHAKLGWWGIALFAAFLAAVLISMKMKKTEK